MAEFESKRTTDHETIRRWAEERGGQPAQVKRNDDSRAAVLRFSFPDYPVAEDVELEPISWEEFFRKFDEKRLALLYRERTPEGELGKFNKFTVG